MIFRAEIEGSPIFAGEECLILLSSWLEENFSGDRLFILTDKQTRSSCLPILSSVLGQRYTLHVLDFEGGEQLKTINSCIEIWEQLTVFRAERSELLLNLGGGVVSDLGGFIASTYKRGIGFINIPTSLMGMTDAAIGGKNGVDFLEYKNLIGTITFPEATFIWPGFLKTLPQREFRNGLAEIYKHGLIADKNLWEALENTDAESIIELIPASLQVKVDIVNLDPMENSRRKSLNFGHTIGHAIEGWFLSVTPFPVLHGEAIVAGMMMEVLLSVKYTALHTEVANEIIRKLKSIFGLISFPLPDPNELLKLMLHDKKNKQQTLRFSLITSIGNAVWDIEVDESDVKEAVMIYQSWQIQ
ncbi:3-dehydroquinate synthase [soil metagenome]